MERKGRIMTSLMMLVIFTAFVIQSFSFHAEARTMPLIVGIPGTLLCVCQLLIELRSRQAEGDSGVFFLPGELPVIIWLLATVVALVIFGFSLGSPPMVAVYLFFIARERAVVALTSAAFSFIFLYVFFQRIMNAQLFEGLMFQHQF